VTVCDALFEIAPRVHVPATTQTTTGQSVFYAAFLFHGNGGGVLGFVDSAGTFIRVLDDHGHIVSDVESAALPDAMAMPTNRSLYTIYKVTGELRGVTDRTGATVNAIRLRGATPAVKLPGKVIDSLLVGSWDGWAAAGLSPGSPAPGCFGDQAPKCFDSPRVDNAAVIATHARNVAAGWRVLRGCRHARTVRRRSAAGRCRAANTRAKSPRGSPARS